ncbi:MAG TPA: sugar phosphate isomerase/epimerase family protein [Candidatus Sulfotelmatobacter sp.]|nr:sugar phosphate isomerase/epimerase family protein [Candidatus Sulfotelmatobacter sp.]
MKLGIGTYTYMWSIGFPGAQPATPLDALGLLRRAHELGVRVVQFGPNLSLSEVGERKLRAILAYARDAQIELEIGTRGLNAQHLRTQLGLAARLDCKLLRTVPELDDGSVPTHAQLVECLAKIIPDLERHRIRLALENGNIPAQDLADMLDAFASPWLGVTLDTANSLAIPEGTREVVKALARHTMCFHVKDFVVERVWHRMGFVVQGRPAGRGQMDLPWILRELQCAKVDSNAILELWPPEQADIEATITLEKEWAQESIQYLRQYI